VSDNWAGGKHPRLGSADSCESADRSEIMAHQDNGDHHEALPHSCHLAKRVAPPGSRRAATAQTKPARIEARREPIRSILWVGNSFFYYNNSMQACSRSTNGRMNTRRLLVLECGADVRVE
jgi:hypothetical protein